MQNVKLNRQILAVLCSWLYAGNTKFWILNSGYWLLLFAFLPKLSPADTTRPEVAAYDMPHMVLRVGPLGVKPMVGHTERIYNYYLPSQESETQKAGAQGATAQGVTAGSVRPTWDSNNLIAREIYIAEPPRLVHQTLFKQGKQHGIEKLWFDNGQIYSATPFFEGQIDGTCRQWNQAGQLIAQYDIKDGTGHRQIYGTDGILQIDEPLEKSIPHGLRMERTPKGERVFIPHKDGFIIGQSYKFSAAGILQSLNFFTDDPYEHQRNVVNDADFDIRALHGPSLTWDQKGALSQIIWWVNNQQVTPAQYANAAKTDKSLPPYFTDANQYKTLIPPGVLALEQKYRTQPAVRIPLR